MLDDHEAHEPGHPEFKYHPEQYRYWAICSKPRCDWFVERGAAGHEWWLDSWNDAMGVRLVRCPWHWSYRSLERTVGKSQAVLDLWPEALAYAAEHMFWAPYLMPFPIRDAPLEVIQREDFPINFINANMGKKSNYGNLTRRAR